jgi:hypothetical protein
MSNTNAEATEYLHHLLNKTLRVHTTDSRIFVGTMKCTDRVRLPLPFPRSFPLLTPYHSFSVTRLPWHMTNISKRNSTSFSL